jgi:acetyl esterase
MARVVDVTIPPAGVRCRLYVPHRARGAITVFLHGGGWVIGDLETHDRACRVLADVSGVAFLAVDYRRAPEHPWPAAVDDAVAALRWLTSGDAWAHGSWTRVGIAGDSAGGTTAALACLRLRDGAERLPDALVMVYANTDLTGSGDSMRTEGHGYGLEREDIEWFNAQWVPDRARWTDPAVSPLRAGSLRGLPPTVVVTCEHDPLRDQGEAFAERLRTDGVPTVARREPGLVHNFLLWDLVSPACADATVRVAEDLARALVTG